MVEQRPFKPKVVGSIPTAPTKTSCNLFYQLGRFAFSCTRCQQNRIQIPRPQRLRFELFLPRLHPERVAFLEIRVVLCPSKILTRSIGVSFSSSSILKVSRTGARGLSVSPRGRNPDCPPASSPSIVPGRQKVWQLFVFPLLSRLRNFNSPRNHFPSSIFLAPQQEKR